MGYYLSLAISTIRKDKPLCLVLLFFAIFRLAAAYLVPLGADESYYFDWSKEIHLSYYDHPPGVSWLAYLGQLLFGVNQFGARFGSIICYFLSTTVLVAILHKISPDLSRTQSRALIVMTILTPILSLGGFFIMPDIGLCLMLSLLLLNVLVIESKTKLSWWDAISCGLLWGLSFDFKYHALALGGGTLFSLLLLRRRQLGKDWKFWLVMPTVFLFTASPVFYWNYTHGWVSFLFQTNHGFAQPTFNIKTGLQTLIGQFVLLTPLVVISFILSFKQLFRSRYGVIFFWSTAPLALLLFVLSFYKQVLPHWVIPAIWLALPMMSYQMKKPRLIHKINWAYGLLLTISIPSVLGISHVRDALLASLDGQTGSLAELTVWDYLAEEQFLKQKIPDRDSLSKCDVSMVSLRWFSTSQLAARFPGLRVYNLDDRLSYYAYRDKEYPVAGCPVLIVSNKKHYREPLIKGLIDIDEKISVKPKYHEDHTYILASGKWK